jgi:hypothetical protein
MTSKPQAAMSISIKDLELPRRERLRGRLELAARLTCAQHGQRVVGVIIHGRENGWFDSQWTTCCESLEREAVAIVKERC